MAFFITKTPEKEIPSGVKRVKKRQNADKLTFFSHLDFTIGSGIPPDHA
jgi:hypothetical protein